eukprot:symbB.v1.2.037472.t1/scaffold5516.1/size39530/1
MRSLQPNWFCPRSRCLLQCRIGCGFQTFKRPVGTAAAMPSRLPTDLQSIAPEGLARPGGSPTARAVDENHTMCGQRHRQDAALMRLLLNACGGPPTPITGDPRKREMCLEFLEAGVCSQEPNCPFAHNPDELYGYEPRWSPGQFNSAQHVEEIDQMRLQAEQRRQQERLSRQAACAVVSDRSAAAADDLSLRGLVDSSSPAPKRW